MSKFACCILFILILTTISYALNPVIFFPGYSLCTITVNINGAEIEGCPSSGSFDIFYQFQPPVNGISEECIVKFITLNYDDQKQEFTNQNGVTFTVAGRDIGSTESLHPLYSDMINLFVRNGYTTGKSDSTFRGICYDWRSLPYADVKNGGMDDPSFMDLTEQIVKDAYTSAGNEKVYFVGHSNGPIYAHYFLNNIDQSFREKYIAGSILLSGNMGGAGLTAIAPILGFTVADFTFSTLWTPAMLTFPSNYMSAAQPEIFKDDYAINILVDRSRNKSYTPQQYDSLYTDANAPFAKNHWRNWISVVTPTTYPYGGGVKVHAFWPTGIETAVGVYADSLPIQSFDGSTFDNFLLQNGDINQEYIDNESVLVWEDIMPDGCFSYTVLEGLDHFSQCADPGVIDAIFTMVTDPVSTVDCLAPLSSVATSDNADSDSTSDSSLLSFSGILSLLIFVLAF